MNGKKKFMQRLAGTMVLIGFIGGWFVHPYFYLVDAFVGLNMWQSSFTDFCLPEMFYEKYLAE